MLRVLIESARQRRVDASEHLGIARAFGRRNAETLRWVSCGRRAVKERLTIAESEPLMPRKCQREAGRGRRKEFFGSSQLSRSWTKLRGRSAHKSVASRRSARWFDR